MAQRLKSVLKTVQLRLILKSFIFAGLLLWVKAADFRFLPIFVFLAVSFFFYFRHYAQDHFGNFYSFVVLLVASLYSVYQLSHFEFLLLAIVFFAFLFYASLGIKEFAFTRRFEWNYAKNILLVYSVLASYFLTDKYFLFPVKFLAVFVVLFFVAREWLSWLYASFPKRYNLAALVLAFVMLQIVWAISLLPFGFINSATLAMIVFYVGIDFLLNHFRGAIDKKMIIKNSLILVLSALVIFFFTSWKI